MIRLYRRFRPLTYLFALVQLLLPGALGVVHAMSARDQHGSPSHIEATTGRDCAVLHGDDCSICRVLSTGVAGSDHAPSLPTHAARSQTVAIAAAAPQSDWRQGFNSRAPPVIPA